MKDGLVIFGVFALLLILGFATRGTGGIFSNYTNSASSTPETTISGTNTEYTPPVHTPTPAEVEQRVANIYRQLDSLSEELRRQKLREPVSPYAGKVVLSIGNTWSTDPESEYLTLRANSDNAESIAISDWYLESYVTDERAYLPEGDRTIERWRSPERENILLEPSESAYLYTGDSPIDVSFHENKCTGYFLEKETFPFGLSRSCPSPREEMERYGNIALDNDECYAFVNSISACTVPKDKDMDDADIGSACRRFIENTLNYNDCILKHRTEPFFDNVGNWQIYLGHDDELWRTEREIIRLLDGERRVIEVIEY